MIILGKSVRSIFCNGMTKGSFTQINRNYCIATYEKIEFLEQDLFTINYKKAVYHAIERFQNKSVRNKVDTRNPAARSPVLSRRLGEPWMH